ncbi:hypothetical protein H0H93_007666 [Arthromyces matolae]|nr:hypothetical protein H0H93_007666 [Arthromyces matolae]
MISFTLVATFVAYIVLSANTAVNAVPTTFQVNSTQSLSSVYRPSPNNPFVGLTLDFAPSPRGMDLAVRSLSEANLESRQLAQIAQVAEKIITKIIDLVKNIINKDKTLQPLADKLRQRRAHFTQEVVTAGFKAHPEFNWIICHPKHHYNFKGVKGKDWDHEHKEFDVSFHKTVGYEVYYLREGEFWLEGDGAELNWFMEGFFKRDGKEGHHVTFSRPAGH